VNEANDNLKLIKDQAQAAINELQGKLTQKLEVSAFTHKAIERERKVKNAESLLQVLFVYAVSNVSQRMLSVCAFFMGAGKCTYQAWQKRILKCVPWLAYLLSDLMITFAKMDNTVYRKLTVHLVDASTFKQEGPNGLELRLHMNYNLTTGTMEEVKITDKHTAESFANFKIKPSHLYIGDAGYGKGKQLEHLVSRKAHALFRITPHMVRLAEDNKGKKVIKMAEKLNTKKKFVELNCFVRTEKGRYLPVRIIASRLPEDKALLAKERKRRKASKNQQKLGEETLIYAEWVILMTTLDESYSAQYLLELYRARWQVELLFKRIKQFFKVQKLRKATLEHSEALVLLWLIIWAMAERQAIAAEIYLLNKHADMTLYSPWTMCDFFFRRFQATFNSLWAFCFDFKVHICDVYRLLCNNKQDRLNQYAYFRFGLGSFPSLDSEPLDYDLLDYESLLKTA